MFEVERRKGRITLRIFMTGPSLFRTAIGLAIVALCTGCAEMEPGGTYTPQTEAPAPTPIPGYWHGDGIPGTPKIIVNLTDQRAYFYKGKNLVGESSISTGKPGFSTPPGQYRVILKDKDHVSTVFGDYVDDFGNVVKSNIDSRKDPRPKGSHYDGARMPYAMFFRGGYAMHQGYVPPYAASHGCIRLPKEMAPYFFDASPLGTSVTVKE
jgi:lipoprotein-anchoring transpeptidase ErfK/SrfK